MAEHNATFELFYDGDWHPAPVLTRDRITVMRGVKTPGNDTDPASGGLTIDNTSGLYAPKSVLSALYGKVGQNTLGRVTLDSDVRLTGETASWKPQRPVKGSGSTPVELGGVLRRIGRGTDPLRPPLTRAVLGLSPTAFWPLDEANTATQFASFASGVAPMTLTEGVLPGQYEDLRSMPRAADPGTGSMSGVVDATLVAAHADVTWTGGFAMKIGDVPLNDPLSFPALVSFYTGGTYYRWDVTLLISSLGDITMTMKSDQGFDRTYSNHLLGADLFDGTWHYYEFTVGYSTGTNKFTVTTVIDGTTVDTTSDTATTTVSTCGVREVVVNPTHQNFGAFGISALYVRNGTAPTLYAGAAVDGYAGETAPDRFVRLCGEEGITSVVVGTAAESVAMGPQGIDPLLSQLDEIARTDDASIFETKDDVSLTMRTGPSKLNQTAALTLSYRGQVQPPLRPVFGDAGIRNDVTAKNPGGSSGRVVQETGPQNVQLPEDDPQGVGRYSTDLDVNTDSDTQLADEAGWRVNLGTYDGTWYASVTVDLDAAPGLTTAVNAVDIGDVVVLTDLPIEDSIGDFHGIVVGIEDDAPPKRRLVTFYLAPGDPYMVGVLAATAGDTNPVMGYAETDASVVVLGAGAAATTVLVRTGGGPLWTVLADDFPQNVVMGAQRIGISAVSSAVSDAYGRSVSSGFGTEPTSGVAYTTSGGSASDYNVAAGAATMAMSGAANVFRTAVLEVGTSHKSVIVQVSVNVGSAAGATITEWVCGRYLDSSNYYVARLDVSTAGVVSLLLAKRVAGTLTTLAGSTTVGTAHVSGDVWRVRIDDFGDDHAAYAWQGTLAQQPAAPTLSATDSAVPAGTALALLARRETGNTDTGLVVTWDNLTVVNPQQFTVDPTGRQIVYPVPAGAAVTVAQPLIPTM